MTVSDDATVAPAGGVWPDVGDAGIAAGARIVGAVHLGPGTSVWYNAVLRADRDAIAVGAGSNVQDGVTVHVDRGHPVRIGADVSVGHNAVVHGCTIEDGCLIGMGSVILSGAVIGAGSLVAAGAVVLEGTLIPPGSLVAGVPAKVRRPLTDDERAGIARNAETYRTLAAELATGDRSPTGDRGGPMG